MVVNYDLSPLISASSLAGIPVTVIGQKSYASSCTTCQKSGNQLHALYRNPLSRYSPGERCHFPFHAQYVKIDI